MGKQVKTYRGRLPLDRARHREAVTDKGPQTAKVENQVTVSHTISMRPGSSAEAVTDSHSFDEAERKGRERARKLAAVPEPIFTAHLEQSDPDKLSEAAFDVFLV